MEKVYSDAVAALDGLLSDDMTIMAGGFGLCGIPENLIRAVMESGISGLTVISNNAGIDGAGLGLLLETNQTKKMVASYVGENKLFEKQFLDGDLEVEFNPQGTLAERIRAAGAGIPGFYTRTSVDTPLAEGKEVREFAGLDYVLEEAIYGDVALVKAAVGDRWGNLTYTMASRNFNPVMAMGARTTIAQVSEIVDLGGIEPEQVITPSIFVDKVVQVES
jgi:3-oxoacid CoA-transferase subunit A